MTTTLFSLKAGSYGHKEEENGENGHVIIPVCSSAQSATMSSMELAFALSLMSVTHISSSLDYKY